MGLKNLLSNLAARDLATETAKDLTYGKGTAYDRPNQGFSNEPFIKGGINLGGTSTLNSITGGFIRGGVLMHAERLIQDTTRIGKFYFSARGITFLTKQVGLQKANPKISEPSISGKSPANHRTYNFGVNTLAQVIGQGTGLHVNRQGLTPLAKNGYADEEKFLNNYKQDKNKNRLLFLYDNHISRPLDIVSKEKKGIAKVFQKIKKAFKKPGEELYSYGGGPGSTYGIGQTKIQKYSITPAFEDLGITNVTISTGKHKEIPLFNPGSTLITGENLIYKTKSTPQGIASVGFKPLIEYGGGLTTINNDFNFIDKFARNRTFYKGNPSKSPMAQSKFQHEIASVYQHELDGKSRVRNYLYSKDPRFRIYKNKNTNFPTDNYNQVNSDGKSYHREERIGLGRPGGNPTNQYDNSTVDLINALDVFKNSGDLNSNAVRDLIRFRIEAVNPYNTSQSDVMVFRAFLDSMDDSFNANYNEFNYNGRAESFYTYNGFNRSISFSFKIAAQSAKEMKPLYRKLNYLLSNTAPEYNTTSGRMMTPFMKLTIGAYFERLPGVITNVGIKWQKDYPWEITLDAPEGGTTSGLFTLPHVLDINVTYQPIHDFLPQKGMDSPFIIPHKGSGIATNDLRRSWNKDKIKSSLGKASDKINEDLEKGVGFDIQNASLDSNTSLFDNAIDSPFDPIAKSKLKFQSFDPVGLTPGGFDPIKESKLKFKTFDNNE